MLLAYNAARATHNRAGEISYRQIGNLTYEATVVSYTDSRSAKAYRATISLDWGDGTIAQVDKRQQDPTQLPNNIWFTIYRATHTYAGPGQYIISFEDP